MSIRSILFDSERLSKQGHAELATLLIAGRLPIAIMAIAIAVSALISSLESFHPLTISAAVIIVGLLAVRAMLVTRFLKRRRTGEILPAEIVRWEAAYMAVVIPYGAVFGLFTFQLTITGSALVHTLVSAVVYAFGAGMVSRGYVRPKLCAIMMFLGTVPASVGMLMRATDSAMVGAISYGLIGVITLLFASSSMETVGHLYAAMLAQINDRHKLAAMARVDPLTGLANRLAMSEYLASAPLQSSQKSGLLLIDLDGFKGVNDSLGHPAGDRLLKVVATRLSAVIREGDIAVRLGGDEFAVIQQHSSGLDATLALARRIAKSITEIPDLSNGVFGSVCVGASVGVTLFDASTEDVDVIVDRADRALYRAKHVGGNAVRAWYEEPTLRLVA